MSKNKQRILREENTPHKILMISVNCYLYSSLRVLAIVFNFLYRSVYIRKKVSARFIGKEY